MRGHIGFKIPPQPVREQRLTYLGAGNDLFAYGELPAEMRVTSAGKGTDLFAYDQLPSEMRVTRVGNGTDVFAYGIVPSEMRVTRVGNGTDIFAYGVVPSEMRVTRVGNGTDVFAYGIVPSEMRVTRVGNGPDIFALSPNSLLPMPPGNLVAAPSVTGPDMQHDGQCTLSWTPSPSVSAPITGYRVQYTFPNMFMPVPGLPGPPNEWTTINIDSAATTTITITDLIYFANDPETAGFSSDACFAQGSYLFRVAAVNALGISSYSEPIEVIISEKPLLSARLEYKAVGARVQAIGPRELVVSRTGSSGPLITFYARADERGTTQNAEPTQCPGYSEEKPPNPNCLYKYCFRARNTSMNNWWYPSSSMDNVDEGGATRPFCLSWLNNTFTASEAVPNFLTQIRCGIVRKSDGAIGITPTYTIRIS